MIEGLVCNVTQLVTSLAQDWAVEHVNPDMDHLHDRAQVLAMPVLDYEGAAREAGWVQDGNQVIRSSPKGHRYITADNWEEACECDCLAPHERQVHEFWLVTDLLGRKLQAKGEKVDMDFAGLCIWARTPTGISVEDDEVLQ